MLLGVLGPHCLYPDIAVISRKCNLKQYKRGADPICMYAETGAGSGGWIDMLRQWSLCLQCLQFNWQEMQTHASWIQKLCIYFADASCIFAGTLPNKDIACFQMQLQSANSKCVREVTAESVLWLPLKAFKHIMVWHCTARSKACCQGNSSSSAYTTTMESYFTCRVPTSLAFC